MKAAVYREGHAPCFFDIVNGFLIDAVAHRVKKMGAVTGDQDRRVNAAHTICLIWREPNWADVESG